MKGLSKIFILFFAVVLTMAACSSKEEKVTGDQEVDKTDTKVELTAWAWNVNVGALNEAAEKFKAEYPNVELKVEDMGRLDVYDKLSTGLAAGGIGLPDILLVEDDRVQGYLQAFPNGFVNLSDKGFDENANLFPNFKKEMVSKDGDFYGFPFDAGPGGMFYRTDIFEAAGVSSDDIETWEDFLVAGKQIKEATGAYAMPLDMYKDDPTYRMMLNQLGVYYFDEEGNIDLTNPKAVQAMQTLKDFADADLIKDIDGWNGIVSSTIDGSVAAIPFGAWYYGTITDQAKNSEGNWGVFLLPAFEKGGNRASNLGGSNWLIPAASKNIDEAYAFLNFFSTSDEVQLMAMEEFGLFPSLASVYESELFIGEVDFFGGQPIWKVFANQMEDVPTAYYTNDYAIGLDEAIKAQADVFNGKDVNQALEEAANRLASRTKRELNNY
ncbi:sugar ABC transporter substrate-binding protein [Bacillaceae bacterium IKA-2]|nr:sugar ABC transporter substrate-binding protein [Bacillaceae bacterium IKA-2]